ncbi:MAG: MGMT family protein [Patescibacteria group bacterium]
MKLTNFQKRVYNIVKRIPKGKVTTYQEIGKILGNSRLARAVGNALNKNPFPFLSNFLSKSASSPPQSALVPCHRVIKSNGSLGGYRFGQTKKKKLLLREGVKFVGDKIDQRYIIKIFKGLPHRNNL